jgi:hypothetical protein
VQKQFSDGLLVDCSQSVGEGGLRLEKFLEAMAIAWNPIGQVRRKLTDGSLTLGSVLIPFIGIVVACNLFAAGAQKFFWESALYAAGGELPGYPLMNSDFAQRFLSAIGVLVPLGAAALLPARFFDPRGRNATLAAMLVVAAAWAFYGAAISVPVNIVAGALANVDLMLMLRVYLLASVLVIIGILGLTLFFWFRIMVSVLKLSTTHVIGISLTVLTATALVCGFFLWVVLASHVPESVG